MKSRRKTLAGWAACGIALFAAGVAVAAEDEVPGSSVPVVAATSAGDAEYRAAYAAYSASRPDTARALDSARRAARAGNLSAAFLLGVMYEAGSGVDRNLAEARKWFETAAATGDRAALFNLGAVALRQHDAGAAAAAFRAAAEKGLAGAQVAYGQSLETGEGTERNESEALKWYRLAAEGGDALGAYLYGAALARGLGGTEKNAAEAARWFQVAAGQSIGPAQVALGLLYAGGDGVAKDEVAAAAWFKKSADAGVPEGMYQYAVALLRGLGATKNSPEAIKLFRRLVEWGHPGAMQALAAAYFSGDGTAADPRAAYFWAAMALKHLPDGDLGREHIAQLKAVIEKNISAGERVNLDVRTATYKMKPAPPLLALPSLLPPPAPGAPASRGDTVRGAEPRAAPSRPGPGDSSLSRSGAGLGLMRSGADEAGVVPLDPSTLTASPTGGGPAVGSQGADEAGVAPLDPSRLPVAPALPADGTWRIEERIGE
jgi:TPR repeat protein